MEKITLSNPLTIDDEQVKEISYDGAAFTVGEYMNVCNRRKGDLTKMVVPTADYALLFDLGVGIILASNRDKGWTAEDFNRLKGHDIWQVTQVGYVFFTGTRDEQQENSSVEQ